MRPNRSTLVYLVENHVQDYKNEISLNLFNHFLNLLHSEHFIRNI